MLRVDRPALDDATATVLRNRAAAITVTTVSKTEWKAFKKEEAATITALEQALSSMSAGKCVYCDWADGTDIEHHWPKSPHTRHNGGRGTALKMYEWQNLLWSCMYCNSIRVKGAHMKWDADDVPLLIDPSIADQDPLHLLDFDVDVTSPNFATMAPRHHLNTREGQRGDYTIRRLKLNLRADLRRARENGIRFFLVFEAAIHQFGPLFELPEGQALGRRMMELLTETSPHLGPIRQILQRDPARWQRLVAAVPELAALTVRWNRPVAPTAAANTTAEAAHE